jgi:glycosyltransferase involved in cell wall biosynthesis
MSDLVRVRRRGRDLPIGTVVSFMDLVGMLALITCQTRTRPRILFARGHGTASITFFGRYRRTTLRVVESVQVLLQKLALRRADHVVTVSRELARTLGVENAFIAPEVDWWGLENAASLAEDRQGTLAVFIGRLELEKGPELAIRAAAAAESIGHLVVIGDGSLREHLAGVASEVAPHLQVEFVRSAQRQDVYTYLQSARVLIAPSLSEGFPLAPIEALAMGAAVVASDAGGLPESVGWSDRGLVVRGRSVADWAARLDAARAGDRLTGTELSQLRRSRNWWTLQEVLDQVTEAPC